MKENHHTCGADFKQPPIWSGCPSKSLRTPKFHQKVTIATFSGTVQDGTEAVLVLKIGPYVYGKYLVLKFYLEYCPLARIALYMYVYIGYTYFIP